MMKGNMRSPEANFLNEYTTPYIDISEAGVKLKDMNSVSGTIEDTKDYTANYENYENQSEETPKTEEKNKTSSSNSGGGGGGGCTVNLNVMLMIAGVIFLVKKK